MKNLLIGLALSCAAYSAPIYFYANLTGPAENPPNASTATGFAEVIIDTVADTLLVHVRFNGLTGGPATAGHIHCCVAPPGNVGVAVGLPGLVSATSGVFLNTFNTNLTATYGGAFLTASSGTAAGAEAALAAGLAAGQAYVNIHNSTFPGGEIRGFLVAAPEPTTIALVGGALAGLLLRRRRRS
jgi:hypothetical protein